MGVLKRLCNLLLLASLHCTKFQNLTNVVIVAELAIKPPWWDIRVKHSKIVYKFFEFYFFYHTQEVPKVLLCIPAHKSSNVCIELKQFLLQVGQAVITRFSLEREAWGSNLGSVKSTKCCQRLATIAIFLRKELCWPGAMTKRWGPASSLQASA